MTADALFTELMLSSYRLWKLKNASLENFDYSASSTFTWIFHMKTILPLDHKGS